MTLCFLYVGINVCMCMYVRKYTCTRHDSTFWFGIRKAIIISPWVSNDTSGTHSDKVSVGASSNILWALCSRGRSTAKGATT